MAELIQISVVMSPKDSTSVTGLIQISVVMVTKDHGHMVMVTKNNQGAISIVPRKSSRRSTA